MTKKKLITILAVVLAFSSSSFGAPVVPAIPRQAPVVVAAAPASSPTVKVIPAVVQAEAPAPVKSKPRPARPPVHSRVASEGHADRRVIAGNIRNSTQRPSTAVNVETKTVYSYSPGANYTMYCAVNRVTDIQLQPGERLTGPPIAGDTVRWVVGTATSGAGAKATTHILVKPVQAGLVTNFIITTDRHSYHLTAKSTQDFYVPVVSWNYPQEEMDSYLAFQKENQILEEQKVSPSLTADDLNFKYKIKGDDYPWKPVRVFDDKEKTYIQMSPTMKTTEAPAFFIKEGKDLNLVNYRLKGDFFIVDRLFDEAEFRSGKDDVVRIVRQKKKSWFFKSDDSDQPKAN